MLVWTAVRTTGLADQGLYIPIPASPPEVDIRPALVVLPAGSADHVFLRIFHEGLSIYLPFSSQAVQYALYSYKTKNKNSKILLDIFQNLLYN